MRAQGFRYISIGRPEVAPQQEKTPLKQAS